MNPYKVLGIRPNASLDEIKTAYESLANTYDISNYQGSSKEPLAEDKISELNTAYNSLINEYKYKDIRDLIENQQFLSAETQLIILLQIITICVAALAAIKLICAVGKILVAE